MGHNFNTFLTHYGILALFFLMLVKAVGVPIPVPTDVVIIAAATASASSGSRLPFWQAFGVILVALVMGGAVQFLIIRGPGRGALYRYGRFIRLTPARLDTAFRWVENVGIIGIGLAVVTPGVRTAVTPACALTKIPFRRYLIGLTLGSTALLTINFVLGYAGATVLLDVWNGNTLRWALVVVVPVAIVIVLMTQRHRTRHVLIAHAVDDVFPMPSAACPLCWMVTAGDTMARRRAKHPAVSLETQAEDEKSLAVAIRAVSSPTEAAAAEPN